MRLQSDTRMKSLAALAATALALGSGLAAIPATATVTSQSKSPSAAFGAGGAKQHQASDKGSYDARTGGGSLTAQSSLERQAARASARPATQDLRASVGGEAVVEMDGFTGTVRQVARLDGYLTPASSQSAAAVVMGYVGGHLAGLGLTSADLATLTLRRDYVDVDGIHHLSWTQSAGGVEVFGNGLQANVTKDGRLLSLGGSPLTGLRAPAAGATEISSGKQAISAAREDVAEPAKAGPADTARAVLFATSTGVRRGWETITMSASRPMLSVVDAATGKILYRRDLSSDAAGSSPLTRVTAPAALRLAAAQRSAAATVPSAASKAKPARKSTGLAFRYFPKHKPGGRALHVNYTKHGWLPPTAHRLAGNNTHTYADVNDSNTSSKTEEIRAKTPHSWAYRLKPFHLKRYSFCDNPYPCSWNPNKAYSWRVNRNQNASQIFYFVNNWHDHLRSKPIGFTEAAGNFEHKNKSGKGMGRDAVEAQTDDGANTDNGLPDGNHIDNANMSTPPDGHAPTMQMYLQHAPFTSYPDGDPFSPTNVGDEADTVYHEYTHGLSNRLVVDAAGRSTLGDVQAGAMGEAWSDWYAMDYLVAEKLQKDRPGSGNVVLFQYDGAGVYLDRTEPIDCAVGATTSRCPGGETGHTGGYTYADYGHVGGGPEVHDDGEIWAQTLWDLRYRLGSKVSEKLVTRAMELSPSNPSFLDERNAILLADLAVSGGKHHHGIWKVFAARGMGYYAGSLGGNDTSPGASFAMPPKGSAAGGISGRVTDDATGDPIQGALVTIAFQGSPFVTNPSTRTDAQGRYNLGPVPSGRYPKVTVNVPGYDEKRSVVVVKAAGVALNAALRRDWAASSGGAEVVSAEGDDLTPIGCGAVSALDQSDGTGWSVNLETDGGVLTADSPKAMVFELPRPVDVSEVTINPTQNCGDAASAATGAYRVEFSTNGTAWTTTSEGEFRAADLGSYNSVPLTGATGGVRFVRYTIKAPLVFVDTDPDTGSYPEGACAAGGAYSGCSYEDVTEIKVYGTP